MRSSTMSKSLGSDGISEFATATRSGSSGERSHAVANAIVLSTSTHVRFASNGRRRREDCDLCSVKLAFTVAQTP
jgi:hypothetical protein